MDPMPMILFAQKGGGGAAAGGAAIAGVGMLTFFCILGFSVLLSLAMVGLQIWYLVSTYQALNACAPRNRDMDPGMVFLVFIPVFGPIWNFFVVLRTSGSLEKEFRARGMRGDGDFGRTIGLWGLILPFTCIGLPAAPICLLLYVMRVRAFTAQLYGSGRSSGRDRDDDDDDD